MYGSRVDHEGNTLQGDSSFVPAVAGPKVKGNVLAYIGLGKDQNGNTVEDRLILEFTQANGATFRQSYTKPSEEADVAWQKTNLERHLLHIATKVSTEDEWFSAIEANSFEDYVSKVAAFLMPKMKGKKYTLKITYNAKGYMGFPLFPNFIEDDTQEPSTLSTNSKYDLYIKPNVDAPASAATASDTGAAPDAMPF